MRVQSEGREKLQKMTDFVKLGPSMLEPLHKWYMDPAARDVMSRIRALSRFITEPSWIRDNKDVITGFKFNLQDETARLSIPKTPGRKVSWFTPDLKKVQNSFPSSFLSEYIWRVDGRQGVWCVGRRGVKDSSPDAVRPCL